MRGGFGESSRCAGLLLIVGVMIAALAAPAAAAPVKPKKPPQQKKPSKPRKPKLKRPPREFFAIQSFEALSVGEGSAVQQARLGTNRVIFAWPAIEPSRGQRDWAYTDSQVAVAARHGLRVLPVLFGMARHAGSPITEPPIRSNDAIAGWDSFAASVARRYGPNGDFWRANPSLPKLPATTWQVWNEPSSRSYWNGSPNGAEYAALVKQTARAVRGVDRDAKIMLAGILPHQNDPAGMGMNEFLRGVYSVPRIRRYFEIVALHPYTVKPRRVIELVERARKFMVRRGDAKSALWITELGWSTGGVGAPGDVTTPTMQASRLGRTYKLLIRRRGEFHLQGIVWHVLRDFTVPNFNAWYLQMGLFTEDKLAKPAWLTLAAITNGRPAGIFEAPSQPPPPPPPPPPAKQNPCFLLIFC